MLLFFLTIAVIVGLSLKYNKMNRELYIKAIHHHMMVYGAEVKIPNDVAEWYEKHFGVEEDNLIDYNEEDVLDEVDGVYDD